MALVIEYTVVQVCLVLEVCDYSSWQYKYCTYEQTSWWMACSKCCVLTIARIFPALFEAQYGVTISTLDSQASTL